MIGFFLFVFIGLACYFLGGLYTVKQQTAKVIELLGKFYRIDHPGLRFRFLGLQRIAGQVSLKIRELPVQVETKTKDNVFVNIKISIQYYVIPSKIYDAFYKLNNPEAQINSYVYDVIRAQVPGTALDQVFENKDDIAQAVRQELASVMDDFGYGILKALVTDIDPDRKVKESMNAINASRRLKEAAKEDAEAEKIRVVKAAEAEAESKALQGKGIADQRLAIVNGLKESVSDFQSAIHGSSASDVMNLVLMTQYFDTLKDIGLSSKTNTILIPHSPSGMTNISEQLRNAIITANEVGAGEK